MAEVITETLGVLVATLAAAEDDTADPLRRHRESQFPSVALNYSEPVELRRGEGQYVYGGDVRQYLGFFGGIVTVSTGHTVPEINRAITDQLDRITPTSTLFLIRSQIEALGAGYQISLSLSD